MPIHHFTPPVNDKLTMKKGDWAGWYQITLFRDGQLIATCYWWNGSSWNHHPNLKRGWKTFDDIRGIVQLVEA